MRRSRQWRLSRTTLMTCGLLAFVGGAGFAKLGVGISGYIVWLLAWLALVNWRHKQLGAAVCLVAVCFCMGWWRGAVLQQQLAPYRSSYNKTVVLTATVLTDAVYADHSQLAFDVGSVTFVEPRQQAVPGSLSIKGFGENAVFRGDQLRIEGRLQTTLGGKQGRMSFAKISLLGHHTTFVDTIRRRFTAGLISSVPEPQASFGIGLLIGQRNTLPDTITKQLSVVGLSHVVAVSGYNLTIIIGAVRRLLRKGSKYQTTVLSLLLIGGFLLVTGLSASMVRAALVSSLSLGAAYYGRTIKPLLLWALAAAVTVAWNPLYVWGDIGWYLSFGAFFGVLIVCPLLVNRVYGPEREPRTLTMVLFESFSAQAVTMPFIMFVFQQASLVALPSNALIVPLVPLGMLLTFIAGLAGMLASALAGWFAWPARLLLTYMLDAVSLLSRVPHAQTLHSLSWQVMIAMYIVLIALCVVLWHRNARQRDTITDTETE